MMPTRDSSSACTHHFADQHIHGIAGVDFATSPESDIRAALNLLSSRRTTSVTASIPSMGRTALGPLLDRLEPLVNTGLLSGVHLEGPFIAPEYAGAHPRHAIVSPASRQGKAFLDTVVEYQAATSTVTMMTVAPELDGFDELVQRLIEHGITPALGHTAATTDQMRAGVETVFALSGKPVVITHLYNAMRSFHHRDPGPLLAVLEAAAQKAVIVELIADGHHVDLALTRWWFEHYPQAVRLVSDASAATLPSETLPLTAQAPMLGHARLAYPTTGGPLLADGRTLASGGKDLLAIHDALVTAGLDHDPICAAMQTQQTSP